MIILEDAAEDKFGKISLAVFEAWVLDGLIFTETLILSVAFPKYISEKFSLKYKALTKYLLNKFLLFVVDLKNTYLMYFPNPNFQFLFGLSLEL